MTDNQTDLSACIHRYRNILALFDHGVDDEDAAERLCKEHSVLIELIIGQSSKNAEDLILKLRLFVDDWPNHAQPERLFHSLVRDLRKLFGVNKRKRKRKISKVNGSGPFLGLSKS